MYTKFQTTLLSLILLMLLSYSSLAQYENVWAFGDRAGLDFNSGSPVAIQTEIDAEEGTASVCDENGRLLFYTEGSIVWNRTGAIMTNGRNLTGQPQLFQGYRTATTSTAQSSVIVPMIDSPDKYYIFSLSAQTVGGATVKGVLYYSIVDMRLNGGLGDVDEMNRGISLDSNMTEKMIAVPGNNCNIWLLTREMNSTRFKSFEITAAGVNRTPVISNQGYFYPGTDYCCGDLRISPDKKTLANNTFGLARHGMELLDFDVNTGIVSNMRVIDTTQGHYSTCFSPDNTKLYTTNVNTFGIINIVQYDLSKPTVPQIVQSMTVVNTAGNSYYTGTPFKLGPDGIIYLRSPHAASTTLDIIRYPNNAGVACQLAPDAISLIPTFTKMKSGFPNNVPSLPKDTVQTVQYIAPPCFSTSANIAARMPGWGFKWNDGTFATQRQVTQLGTYWVQYTGYACKYYIDTFHVAVTPLPAIGATGGCMKEQIGQAWVTPAITDTSAYTYTWSDTAGQILQTHTKKGSDTLVALSPGIYQVHLSKSGCDTTLHIVVPPLSYNVSFVVDSIVCQGKTVSFTNTSELATNQRIWKFGDGSIDTARDPQHIYMQPGSYVVTLINYPCMDSFNRTIIVDTVSAVSFTTDKEHICQGATIYFHPKYSYGTTGLLWNFGDGTQLAGWEQMHSYSDPGLIIVQLTSKSRACPDTIYKDTVQIYPYPVVNVGPDTSLCPGQAPVILRNLDSVSAYSYLWSNGATASEIVVYTLGDYWLQVSNVFGCSTTDSITIYKNCYMVIPNVFSPNGDGVNDNFFPREILSHGVSSFKMGIYNRWGQMIFETTKPDGRGWDGTFNNVSQPEGVYIYMIDVAFANEVHEQYNGNVTLIR